MKRIFRWAFRALIVLVVLLVAALLLKDTMIKSLAERNLRQSTGMEVGMGKLEVGLFTPTVILEGFKLYNLPEFGGGVFVSIPEMRTEYDFGAAIDRRLHLRSLRLNLAEVQVVRNKAGVHNVEVIAAAAAAATNQSQKIQFGGIDCLYLTIGRVKYLDLGDPGNDKDLQIDINNEVARNLNTVADVNAFVMTIVHQRVLPKIMAQAFGGWPSLPRDRQPQAGETT